MKTARFKHVVAKCGRPRIHLLWVKPEQDQELMRAFKAHRVMSVHQAVRGTAKDFGAVGLLKDTFTQFLVFPKSLKTFADRRIVGIDYDLLDSEESPGGAITPARRAKPLKEARPKASAPKPKKAAKAPPAPAPKRVSPPAPSKPKPPPIPLPDGVAETIRKALRDLNADKTTRAIETLRSLLPEPK